jgi:hypothetical protein
MPSRMIHEAICNSQKLARVSCEAEVVYHRLLTKADDYGRYFGTAMIVQNNCFGAGKLKLPNVEKALAELHSVGLIQLYDVNGERYIYIIKWEEKQRVRAGKSKFPEPPTIADNCGQPLTNAPVIVNVNVNENVIVDVNDGGNPPQSAADPPTPEANHLYGEFLNVRLTDGEYQKLADRAGEKIRDEYIERESGWKKANGRKPKSDYATLLNWMRRDNVQKPTERSDPYTRGWKK